MIMGNIKKAAVALVAAGALAGGLATSASGDDGDNTSNSRPGSVGLVPAATAPARVFAVLHSDGTLARGKGVVSTNRLAGGAYDVRFTRRIGRCAWFATVGQHNFSGSSGAGYATITGRRDTKNGMFVETYDGSGVRTDLPVHVMAMCG